MVSTIELQEALTTLGEELSEDEVTDLFLKSESNKNGQIHYGNMCKVFL